MSYRIEPASADSANCAEAGKAGAPADEIEITSVMIDAGIEALRREHYVSDMPMWNARELVEDVIRRALAARRAQIAQHAA